MSFSLATMFPSITGRQIPKCCPGVNGRHFSELYSILDHLNRATLKNKQPTRRRTGGQNVLARSVFPHREAFELRLELLNIGD